MRERRNRSEQGGAYARTGSLDWLVRFTSAHYIWQICTAAACAPATKIQMR